jgi:transposase
MANKTKAINKALLQQAQDALRNRHISGDVSHKIQAIISAEKHGVKAVSEIMGVSRESIMQWIKKFAENGVDGLKQRAGKGRKPLITNDMLASIKEFMQKNPNSTCNAVKDFVQNNHGITVCWSTANRALHKIGLSYITPRPVHYKSSSEAQEDFKKNSP